MLNGQPRVKPNRLCLCSEKELNESPSIKKVKQDIKLVNGHLEVRLPWKKGFPTKLPKYSEEATM
uniref:Uncharacterized protein n=1 Tax=Lepeophtheirus salmonis TaxID=72036 RepID=A0A0K2T5Z1_LEPSM